MYIKYAAKNTQRKLTGTSTNPFTHHKPKLLCNKSDLGKEELPTSDMTCVKTRWKKTQCPPYVKETICGDGNFSAQLHEPNPM